MCVAQQQVDEHPELSAPVQVDLQQLLAVKLLGFKELTLTAAQFKSQQKRPRHWNAGPELAAGKPTPSSSSSSTSRKVSSASNKRVNSSSRRRSWGEALWRDMQQSSSCKHPTTAAAAAASPTSAAHRAAAAATQQQQQLLQSAFASQQQQQHGPYNIWDHRAGDQGSVVELFPQEIRTWLLTVQA
jgi:hypothetical protein